ncbi:hypothetical protein C0J50_22701 [Silurus asotus]|uniref:Uncharacterized protein n=1 Tax=Silurus asotus TaxID=30991 RepID=A0AAD5AKV0_SILAS|nr:hypothetical protein C0J50_22701 [Silurus asotus]
MESRSSRLNTECISITSYTNITPKNIRCVIPGDTTQDWVTKNFGSFSVLAQIRDFSSINGFFNGLDVLHLLTPEQKAELMLYPETASLNQESLSVVLGSLLSSVTPSGGAVNSLNGTMQGTGLSVYSPSPQDPLRQVANVMEHVAKVLQCAGSTNLTLTQETVTSLTLHLSSSLNRLLNQIANTNFSSEDSPFRDVLDRIHNPTHTDLTDKAFITMWFHIKLKPLLPSVTPDYLLCLSAKPFSCQTFQTLYVNIFPHH